MKTNIESIRDKILKDWSKEPRIARNCEKIFNHFLVTNYSDSNHLTNGSIRKLIDSEASDSELLMIIRYLSGSINILSIGFEYINDHDETYEITNEEMELLNQEGIFIDPDSGEPIEKPEENIFIFFKQSDVMRRIKGDIQ